jgi:hypothetical protein
MPEWQTELRQRLASLNLEPSREAEIIQELSQHLDDCYEESLTTGLTPEKAEQRALEELNESVTLRRELRCVERQLRPEPIVLGTNKRGNMIADFQQDLRYGARILMKQPGFTLIAVLTLALGIGANTAIFSVIDAVLLKPLPYPDSEQLMMVYGEFPLLKTNQMRLSLPEYSDFQRQTHSFEASGVFDSGSANLAPHDGGEPERVERAWLTPEMFAVLRVGPGSPNPWKLIVGVVRSVRNQRLDIASLPQAYFPVYQEAGEMYNLSFAVRASGSEPAALAQSVRAAVLEVDRNQPIFDVKPLTQIVADSIALKRLALLLLSVFAVVALALAAAGIYGVMSYAVTRRTHEIGIRMALGAQLNDVLKLLIRQGMKLVCIGMALGVAASLALTRMMKNLLFSVSATDPLTFVVIVSLLTFVALLACWVPARRAMRVDPLVALRCE